MVDKRSTHQEHLDKPVKRRKISEIDAKTDLKISTMHSNNQINDPVMKKNQENKKLKKKELKNQK